MCGQFQIFPEESDLEQPHTESGTCLSHLGGCCLHECVREENDRD